MYTVAGKFKFSFLELSEIFFSNIFHWQLVESELQMQITNYAYKLLLRAPPSQGRVSSHWQLQRRGKVDQLPICCSFQHSEVPFPSKAVLPYLLFSNLRCWLFPRLKTESIWICQQKIQPPLRDPSSCSWALPVWNCPQSSTQLVLELQRGPEDGLERHQCFCLHPPLQCPGEG